MPVSISPKSSPRTQHFIFPDTSLPSHKSPNSSGVTAIGPKVEADLLVTNPKVRLSSAGISARNETSLSSTNNVM